MTARRYFYLDDFRKIDVPIKIRYNRCTMIEATPQNNFNEDFIEWEAELETDYVKPFGLEYMIEHDASNNPVMTDPIFTITDVGKPGQYDVDDPSSD